MNTTLSPCRLWLERLFSRFGFGMRAKLILLFVVIKVVPLMLLAFVAWNHAADLAQDMRRRTGEIATRAVRALAETGDIAVTNAMDALDARATEEIERLTTDTARRVADFLYDCDDDILVAASLPPSPETYAAFVRRQGGQLVKPGERVLAGDGKSWVRQEPPPFNRRIVSSSLAENAPSFRYRPPERYQYVSKPLYLEMTFVGLDGREQIKITDSGVESPDLKDISDRRNTFCRAEDYFARLKDLKPGEIYVSDVIGAYVGTNLIGMYTPENCAKYGVPYEPERQAWAGRENPNGRRFKGLVRWGTPVEREGKRIGYVTLALDHDHIMEFTDHIMPTIERYTEIPDADGGNYAFIWDHNGRSIAHPRHHSICGFDPATGDPQTPWLEEEIYAAWQASGKSYAEFVMDAPVFVEQSKNKKPARELTQAGLVALDCRYLNFAPQCAGWFDLTQDGGSGSFLIRWSGLWKLTTAAAIPYYTGQYAASLRGFGFVSIGTGVADFHRPATETQRILQTHVEDTERELGRISEDTDRAIGENLYETAVNLSAFTALMAGLVILIAIWMASIFTRSITRLIRGISRFRSGERQFRFNAPIKDELGALADSFDEMADSIVNSTERPLAITSLDQNILYMNDEALRLVGKNLEEVIGKPYAQNSIFPEGDRSCPLPALLSGREPDVLHHRQNDRYYRGKAGYLTNKEGQNIGYIIVTTDVTDLIIEQHRIEEQRALLDTVFSSSPDLIWYEDGKGRYLVANPRFAGLFGKTPEEIRGRTAEEVLPLRVAELMKANNARAAGNAAPLYTEERLHFADGHEETLDVVRTPLHTAQGEFMGLLGVARDVSRRVRIENELRHTQQELKKTAAAANRASDSKSAFLARMSHEIRTPMNAIIGMTNIAKRKLAGGVCHAAEVLPQIRQIEVSSVHLLGLLNDILDISKIEAGKIELSEESLDLAKLAANVAAIIRPRCLEKNIDFHMRLEGVEGKRFITDALRLRQVLINLLGNAVKFTPANGSVTFTVRRLDDKNGKSLLGFSVVDTGIGISREGLASLFTPFEQGGGHISRLYGGTGLGLSVSRSIVLLLGGDISVDSEEGKGSEFFFSLWLAGDASPVADKTRADDVSMLPGKRILLVDDVVINRVIVMEHLSHTGLVFDEAGDGLEAVRKFKNSAEGHYDIIFMDVQMPHMDGYEAAEAIRGLARQDAKTVPIITMTANAFKEDVDMAFARGMNAHLAKPLESDKLMEVLTTFLAPGRRT